MEDRLIRFASIRPRSRKEIELWLAKRKVSHGDYKKHFNTLKRMDLAGERRFSKWWVNERIYFALKSKKEILFELKAKGISSSLIKEIADTANFDDLTAAKNCLKRLNLHWKALSLREKQNKAFVSLARKGFSSSIIKRAIDEIED